MRPLLVLLALLLASCASLATRAAGELMQADRDFEAAAQRQGLAAAFADYLDPVDGKMFRPGHLIQGHDAIAAAPFPGNGTLSWAPQGAHAAASGDLGVTWGRWTFRTAAGASIGTGAYVTVWRRDADGRWRGVVDIGNDDP